MISLKVLSTAAAVALALPLFVPGESFAQERPTFGGRGGGGPAVARPAFGGGGARPTFSSGARPTFGGGGAITRPTPSGPAVATGPRYGGGGWHGGYRGGYRHHGYGGGFIPGAVAGAVIGGALASSSYGYYGPSYGYYDDGYYDDGAVAVAPPVGDDSVAYCMQRYKSYDPASGTYLGYDGQRHPCP
jgi:BA14K-like protein